MFSYIEDKNEMEVSENSKTGEVSKKTGIKVKVTLVQPLRLCTGRTAHRGSRGIALFFHDQWH